MTALTWTVACIALIAALPRPAARQPRIIPKPRPVRADMQVGAFYFPGWSHAERWYCVKAHPDVQHPLLGYYREGDPDAADWHIKWALEHGVGFFAFDYYSHNGSQMLEAALDRGLLRSRFLPGFRFCLNWCNHAPSETMTADQLERFAELVIPRYLTHPSYLRIDGRPVLMILSGYSFVKTLGVDGARKAFEHLDARCRAAGLPGVYLVFCEGEILRAESVRDSFAAGARAFCLYNYPYAGTGQTGPGRHGEATYAHLIEQGERLWKHWRGITEGRFWPTVMPGWDRRPWLKEDDLRRTGSTPALFEGALRDARAHVNASRIVMVEAWNEWGEGSVLEPSVEQGFGYLDAVRRVFSPSAGSHRDLTPTAAGLPAPVFDLEMPRIDAWAFDHGVEDWTATGVSGLAAAWGALEGVSTDDDPQLTSPIAYLPCGRYGACEIRMRAEAVDARHPTSTGQLFWSTSTQGLSQEASVTFPVTLDGAWHTYRLDLAARSHWRGTTDRFRLDPVALSGVRFAVDEVRFLRGPARPAR